MQIQIFCVGLLLILNFFAILFLFLFLQGHRITQQTIVDITEKTAEMDQLKGSTLEDISGMVDQINREFKNKEAQLQPLMAELKVQHLPAFPAFSAFIH